MATNTKSRRPAWLLPSAALILALGAGILIGRSSRPTEAPTGQAGPQQQTGSPLRGSPGLTRGERNAKNPSARDKTSAEPRHGADAQLSAILESSSRLERTQRLLAFLDRLPTEQFAAVYEEFRNSPLAELRGSERSLVLQAWAERDPQAALGFLQTNGADNWERETAVAAWAGKDPQAAFEWANSAADEGSVNNWLLGALRGIAATSPELARDFLTRMDANDTRQRALESLQPYVTQYGFDYASRWIADLGDDALRNSATRMLADELVRLDPTKAGAWNASIADVNTRRDVSETVSDRWAANDLAAARSWAESLPEDTRTEAAEGVARHYARQDPAAAAQWLASLGNNPDLDGARRIFIEESFRRDPGASLGFVSQLSDPKARTGYYQRLVGGWFHRDAEAARTWVNQNAGILPADVVKRVLH